MPRSVSAIQRPAASRLATTAPLTCRRPKARTTAVPPQHRDPCRADPRRQLLVGAVRARVSDRRDRDPGARERQRGLEAAIGGRRDQAAASPATPRRGRRAARARAQHHAREVVALEHQRLLDRAGGGDVASARTWCRVSRPRSGRSRRRSRAPRPVPGSRLPRRAPAARARPPIRPRRGRAAATELGPIVGEDDVGARARRLAGPPTCPATPPPITRTSAWRRRYSVRHRRSACRRASRPRPAAWRRTFS